MITELEYSLSFPEIQRMHSDLLSVSKPQAASFGIHPETITIYSSLKPAYIVSFTNSNIPME